MAFFSFLFRWVFGVALATFNSNHYFLQDHLGSTVGLANSGGMVTETNTYDSFGRSTNIGFSSRYQFTGREYDSLSGLQFSRARWYDPNLGRFISEDPIGLGGGINQYGYVSNSPINATDPLGLYPSRYGFTWHQGITQISLEGIASQADIDSINVEQYEFDYETQDMEYAPMHAMSRPGQDRQSARNESNLYIRNQLCIARKLRERGLPFQALPYLGRAIHTLQDSTAPPHSSFQPAWSDSNIWQTDHYISESLVLPANAALAQKRTRMAYEYYLGAPGSPLPNDFFPSDAFDSNSGPVPIRYPVTWPTIGGTACGCE